MNHDGPVDEVRQPRGPHLDVDGGRADVVRHDVAQVADVPAVQPAPRPAVVHVVGVVVAAGVRTVVAETANLEEVNNVVVVVLA